MTAPLRRFTANDPCPICGGHDGLGPRPGRPLLRLLSTAPAPMPAAPARSTPGACRRTATAPTATGCTAACRCGQAHGDAPSPAGKARPAAAGALAASGRAAIPLLLHAVGLSPPPLRRGHGHPPLDLPRRRRARGVPRPPRRLPRTRRLEGQELPPLPRGRRRHAGCCRGPSLPLPLYNLPAILAAPPEAIIAVLEGEKCTDIAAALGLLPRHDQCPRCQGPAAHRLVAAGRPVRRHPPRRGRTTAMDTPPRSPPSWPPSIPPPASRSSPCLASPTARTSSSSSRPAAPPAAPTPRSSPSCKP